MRDEVTPAERTMTAKPRVRRALRVLATSVACGLAIGSPIAYLHVAEWPPIVATFNWLNAHPPGGVLVALFGILYLLVSAPLSLAVSLSEPENVELAARMMLVGWYPTWWIAIGAFALVAQLVFGAWRPSPQRVSGTVGPEKERT